MRTFALALVIGISLSGTVAAAPPLDRLLPADATEFAMSPDLAKLEAGFHLTQFGRLWKEPTLQPFKADASTEMLGWLELPGRLGMKWHDLLSVIAGEAGSGVFPIPNHRIGRVSLIDSTGREDAVNARLAHAAALASRNGGTVTQKTIAGQQVTIYDIPSPRWPRLPIAVFRKDQILAAVTPPDAVEQLMPSWNAAPERTLAGKQSYQVVRSRTVMRPGEPTHFVWYVEPLGTHLATRKPDPPNKKKKVRQPGDVLRTEGFGAMKGIGGSFAFAAGNADFIVRMTIYAPEPEKYFGSFRMLAFKGAENLLPPEWVPGNLSSCVLARMNIRAAFDSFASLFDEVAAEGEKGTFEEILETIKKKPGVDLRGEIVDQLVGDIVTVSDWAAPINTKSERGLAAFTSKNPALVADALARAMRTDPKVTKRNLHGADSWEIKGEQRPRRVGEGPPPPAPDAALCVGQGRFHVSTHSTLMAKIMGPREHPPLLETPDFQRVRAEWESRAGGTACMRVFSRLSEDFRITYEMWRTNQLDKADSLYCRLWAKWAKNGHMPLDGRKLPDYSHIGKYFGPAGIQAIPYGDGWDIVGFALKPGE
jgi:hypothetical protein